MSTLEKWPLVRGEVNTSIVVAEKIYGLIREVTTVESAWPLSEGPLYFVSGYPVAEDSVAGDSSRKDPDERARDDTTTTRSVTYDTAAGVSGDNKRYTKTLIAVTVVGATVLVAGLAVLLVFVVIRLRQKKTTGSQEGEDTGRL